MAKCNLSNIASAMIYETLKRRDQQVDKQNTVKKSDDDSKLTSEKTWWFLSITSPTAKYF